MAVEDLRQDTMMAYLLDSLDDGKDIGHYGRLVLTIVGQYFLDDDELAGYLQKSPDMSEQEAKALVLEVKNRGYSPPKRGKILQWQQEQEFPILPNAEDPDCGNVYRDLKFPNEVYERIEDYYEQKAAS